MSSAALVHSLIVGEPGALPRERRPLVVQEAEEADDLVPVAWRPGSIVTAQLAMPRTYPGRSIPPVTGGGPRRT